MTDAFEPLVLVAEDDADVRMLVRYRLEQAGFRVVAAATVVDALALAAEHHPDVLLLDIGLPDGDGYEVCRHVLATSAAPPAVIFVTGRDTTVDRVAGLHAGAVDYILKPFEPAELVARVQAAVRMKLRVDDLAHRASTDPLTGMMNRSALGPRTEELIALAGRGRPFACVMLDIDHFKQLNDTRGHGAGDEVLREVARRIRGSIRLSDPVFRYGDDEFLALVLDADIAGGEVVGNTLLRAVGGSPIALGDAAEPVSISVSIGVAAWQLEMLEPEDLFAAAGAALYRAKRLGRARVAPAA
jgi:two-component system, cell cycle response regulator